MDGLLPVPQTLTQLLYAGLLAFLGGSSIGGGLGAVALLRLYLERGKPAADIHLSDAQTEKTLAEAGKLRSDSEVSLIGVAIKLATTAHAEITELRTEHAELRLEHTACREEVEGLRLQVRVLEEQLKL